MQFESVNLEIDDYFLVFTVGKTDNGKQYSAIESNVGLYEISDNCPNFRKLYTGL